MMRRLLVLCPKAGSMAFTPPGDEMSEVVSRFLPHRQPLVSNLSKVATQWLEIDSKPRPSGCKAQNIPLHNSVPYHIVACRRSFSVGYSAWNLPRFPHKRTKHSTYTPLPSFLGNGPGRKTASFTHQSQYSLCMYVFSHLLSAAYKMTSGPLHVSLGILVTCKTQ